MSYKLIVVESPEKAKVISTFLDKGWRVVASKGHILDLPEKEYGVKRENNSFSGEYVPSQDSKKIITEIASLVSGAEEVFLATDDDREGEKIASDLVEQCKMKKYHRVTFSEISKKEVITSLENPRKIDSVRLASQKARRLIDRIVGYPGSAAIAQDFKNLGIPYEPSSIGRSIAPGLRLLCQVEEAIQDFEDNPPEKKQLIRVKLEKDAVQFVAKHDHEYGPDEIDQMEMDINMLRRARAAVVDYKPEITQRNPPKPLTTSSYQFGCFYLFGLKPKQAMKYAQALYQLGFISYMRTDSFRVPMEKAIDMQNVIRGEFGDKYCADAPRLYQDEKSEMAQNAHPAILPTSFEKEFYPKDIVQIWKSNPMYKALVADGNFMKVYQFIFLRAIASQMAPSLFSTAKGILEIAGMRFVAKEHMRKFDGWQKLAKIIQEQSDEESKDFIVGDEDVVLPELELGENVKIEGVYSVEAPQQRPRRYGVGRFVSTLAKLGIVRPSTMDQIVEKLEEKHYIEIEAKIVVPTKLGKKVDAWLSLELPEINSLENAKAFESKLEQCQSEAEADALIQEYYDLTFGLLGRKGVFYKKDKTDVSDKQVLYAKKMAAEAGVVLEDSFFKNGENVAKFITECSQALSVGKCPACKKGRVIEKEKVYACDNFRMNCKFMIFKEQSIKFFESFGKRVDESFLKDIIKGALNSSPIMVELVSPKKGTTFSAFIIIESQKPPYWNLSIAFKNKNTSKTNRNGSNFNEDGQGNTSTNPHV